MGMIILSYKFIILAVFIDSDSNFFMSSLFSSTRTASSLAFVAGFGGTDLQQMDGSIEIS